MQRAVARRLTTDGAQFGRAGNLRWLQVSGIDRRQGFGQGRHRLANLLLGMFSRYEEPQTGSVLFDGRIENGLYVDAVASQCVRQFQTIQRIAENHRNYRRPAARAGVQTVLHGQLQKQRGSLV